MEESFEKGGGENGRMNFTIHTLKEYPNQPIKDFAEARNWFLRQLDKDEYVFFLSDHEEAPIMLLKYIAGLKPEYPYYAIRLIRLVNNRLEVLYDPIYQPNLCSNRMKFVGKLHEGPVPRRPYGTIDIPMIHNSDGHHSYREPETRQHILHLGQRLFKLYRAIMWDELGRGLFRKGQRRYY